MIEKVDLLQATALMRSGTIVYKMEPISMDTTLGELTRAALLVAVVEETEQKKEEPKKKPRIDRDKVCALAKANWSVSKIADEMDCSGQTVINILKERGLWKKEE